MNCLQVKCIVNNPVSSNCYVIFSSEDKECIIIDPGSQLSIEVQKFLGTQGLIPRYIILTHHHFDHIWGVDSLVQKYQCKIVASELCSLKIVDKRENLSLYYNGVGFTTLPADITIEAINFELNWNKFNISFLSTPGHTESCISILIQNFMFCGDTLIYGKKTVTKLPGGNKTTLQDTYSLYLKLQAKEGNIIVYPGHGQHFELNTINLR